MRIRQVNPNTEQELARALLGIQHAAYALEAALIDDDRIPALHEDVDDLLAANLLWLAAFIDRRLVGAVGWSEDHEELDIDRLIVAPAMHRRGAGSALIREVQLRAGNRASWCPPAGAITRPRRCTNTWVSYTQTTRRLSPGCG